ncbi:MAG: peptidoglycan-associated lipoprotein Pal [Candidatus Latescibacterota bacterium]
MQTFRVVLMCGLAAAAFSVSGCAGSKPAPPPVEPVAAPTDEDAKRKADEWARQQAEARAAAEREAADREARLKAEQEAAVRAARMLGAVYFDYDDFQIRQDQVGMLSEHADRLKAVQDVKLTLEGHCDERGTIEYNLALGQRRANSVKAFLVRAGVQGERLNLVSYGEQKPADPGHGEAAWARNRRVEFVPTE